MNKPRYWYCLIGPVDDEKIPWGGDIYPRLAARRAILEATGKDPTCSSGWINEDEANAIKAAQMQHMELQRNAKTK